MAIPQIIHQSWKSSHVPPAWQEYQSLIQTRHPSWEYRLWTDDDNLHLVESRCPRLLDTYNSYSRGICRADVVRYVYMMVHGGLYADLDYEMLKTFDLSDHRLVLPVSRESQSKEGFRIGNCVFASEAGHPFWEHVIDMLVDEDHPRDRDPEEITGPIFLTRALETWKGDRPHMPERRLFHPPTPKTENAYRAIVQDDFSYGIHHCSGTWRDRPWYRRILSFGQKA